MMATKDIKKDYKEQIIKTLDEIKEKTDYMLDDITDNLVKKIEVVINIEAGCIVTYKINKEYIAKGDE